MFPSIGLCFINMFDYILAEKRNASINSGVVFLKKIVDFIDCLIF